MSFELNLTLPADARFAVMVKDLVAHGARQAGCGDAQALAFGHKVEGVVREALTRAGAGTRVSVTVRRAAGPMEVRIASGRGARTLAIDG